MPKAPPSAMPPAEIRAFQAHLAKARKVVALVGAGLSASSGLPTFRGAGGLWKQYTALDLATPEAFYESPGLVWQFYSARRGAALAAKPNKGHKALAALSRKWPSNKFLTLTQNVDDLSERASHAPDSLVHLHGSILSLRCTSFSCTYREQNNKKHPLTPALEVDLDSFAELERTDIPLDELPKCPRCGSLMRPGVVWFGEQLPYLALERADSFISSGEVDLILVIGMSATVWPAAGYIDEVAQRGGRVAVFNTDASLGRADGWTFEGDAAEWLPYALDPFIGGV